MAMTLEELKEKNLIEKIEEKSQDIPFVLTDVVGLATPLFLPLC